MKQHPWKFKTQYGESDSDSSKDKISILAQQMGLSELTVQVCLQRGLEKVEQIRDFITPKLESLKDPLSLAQMSWAVDRLVQARTLGERVRVFGDYDVDGTTGAALLTWFFRDSGFQFDAVQPDRFKEGYGLNVQAVEVAACEGVKILITVDCGITSFEAAERAFELGVDLIVIDHHQLDPVRGLPRAFAVINPQRKDCFSGLRELCGCALAFYFVRALRRRGKELGWWLSGQEPNLKQHLDLVVLATAADRVPLVGDNRILVKHGLEVLRFTQKPGFQALFKISGLKTDAITPFHLGFVIGPRINASGRMASASIALELLTTQDPDRAHTLAKELESLNLERVRIQNQVWDEVKKRVEIGLQSGRFQHGVVVADANWHEGVLGIIASRVVETFQKPAAVIALRDRFGKGSVRSYAGKDVLKALRDSATCLVGYGGHPHAAGLSILPEQVENFEAAFNEALVLQGAQDLEPLFIEGMCSLDDFDLKTVHELESLGPFGSGNPEPIFAFRAAASRHQILKGRHLKIKLHTAFKSADAIWFHAVERMGSTAFEFLEQETEWAAVPELNRFMGRITPTLRVKDRRKLPP